MMKMRNYYNKLINGGEEMKIFVTGAAGFIGSNLVDKLLSIGHHVIGYDNFSTGRKEFLKGALENFKFTLIKGDILDLNLLKKSMKNCDICFHLAANADVRFGFNHPRKDLVYNTLGTSNVLEAMRVNNVKKIIFSSTGSIYGEAKEIPTPEDCSFPIQTSLYGASKLAGEGLIQAYCEGYDMQAWIFRFVSILGERYTHGHIYDFFKTFMKKPPKVNVLGDGEQKKSYLYVGDCIDAILVAVRNTNEKINIFNLGTNEYWTVKESIGLIKKHFKTNPKIKYEDKKRGWIGDNPFIYLDTKKIENLGWKPKYTIKEAVLKTIQYLEDNRWVIKRK